MEIKKVNGRTIATGANGAPLLFELVMRPSTTAPTRMKAMFAAADGGEIITPGRKTRKGMVPSEFRLELN